MSKTVSLSVDIIKTNAGTQMRAKVDDDVVTTYAELWRAKHEFPPLDVFYDGTDYVLGDGFHRLYGAKEAKRASVWCLVHTGDVRDAVLFAAGANHNHGLHRSRADKRLSVMTLLEDDEWGKRSQAWIAEQCRVSPPFVRTVNVDRKPSVLAPPKSKDATLHPERVSGRDGKSYPASRPQSSEPAAGDCPKGGDHERGEDGTCTKCCDPRPDEPAAAKQYDDTFDTAELTRPDIADLARLQRPYDEMLNARIVMVKAWNIITSDERDGVYAVDKRNRVDQLLKELLSPIAQARPHAICSECEGKGCKKCKSCGWWPRSVVEGLRK